MKTNGIWAMVAAEFGQKNKNETNWVTAKISKAICQKNEHNQKVYDYPQLLRL